MPRVQRRPYSAFFYLFVAGCLCVSACTGGTIADSQSGESCSGKCDEVEGGSASGLAEHYLMAINADLTVGEDSGDDDPQNFTSRLVGIVDVEHSGEQTTMTLRPCLVELPSIDGKQPYIPHEVVQQTSFSVFGATVEGDTVRTSAGTVLGGVSLTDPVMDPLPTGGHDAQVWDVDEDGHPGLTVMLDGWEIYMAMRLKFSLEGHFESASIGRIIGDALLSIDLEIYGDNIPFVNARNRIGDVLDEIEVLQTQNEFDMRPIDASLATCEVAVDPSLIPEAPVEEPMGSPDDDRAEPSEDDQEEQPDVPAN